MSRFVIRRLLYAVLVIWLVATLVFALLQLSPVAVERTIGGPRASTETLALIRRNLGLDQPVLVQYWEFLKRLLQGDLGYSYINNTAVTELIADRLPTTLYLVLGAGVLWFVGGVAIGVFSATHARGVRDRLVTVFVLIGLSTPPFVMALFLLYLFSTKLGELGFRFFEAGPPLQDHFFQRMILPWLGLAFLMVAAYARLTRGSMMDVMGEDYIRTARAKGLSERRVTYRHGLRAALTPVVTQYGIDLGALIGSTIVTEKVFGLQGVGQLVYQSIAVGDTPVIIGVTMMVTLFVIVANLLVDVGYSFLDPRVRLA
ncbi:ABC transporter permease [Actinomadura fulvescens]|uniref:ABC transporter permease n=1 Tax=Actinomadura fulvescens TaxID=46160 RepID=A0ABP6BY22_9ACTN